MAYTASDGATTDQLREIIKTLTGDDFLGAIGDKVLSKTRLALIRRDDATLTAEEKVDKAAALMSVAGWKRRKNRRYERLSNADKQDRFTRRAASIDERLKDARAAIDWERRNAAEKSLLAWIATYCTRDAAGESALLDYAPEGKLAEAVDVIDRAVGDSSMMYHIQVARGRGKTSFAECAIIYALATGRRHYCVVVSAKLDAACSIVEDIWSLILDSEPFAQDYPDIVVPLLKLNGSWRRPCMVNGRRLKLCKTRGRFMLPDTPNEDGSPSAAAGAMLVAHGFEGRVRGLKKGSHRPDLLLLDDLQNDDSAANEEVVRKGYDMIRGSYLNLGGRQKMSVLMTSTPIRPDDLSELIARDPAWKTTSYPAMISFPDEWSKENHGLWGKYRKTYETALISGDGSVDPRRAATDFYERNRVAMDKGAEVLDERRFDTRAGQVSALQALVDSFYDIGEDAFSAEMQMQPKRRQYAFELTPQTVMQRIRRGTPSGAIVPNAVLTVATTDINPSYALTTTIISFDVQRTGLVAAYHVTPISISDRVNDTEYNAKVYAALTDHARAVVGICQRSGVKLDAFGIDAGGKQFDAVTRFAAESEKLVGAKVTAMTGRAGQNWNPYVRSRIRQPLNDTVYCRGNRGETWLAFNADVHKESAQKALGTETGAAGGLSLFDGGVNHTDFAIQVSNEKVVEKKKRPDGREVYRWRSRDPHDYLDCLSMAYALAGANGISGAGRVEVSRRKVAVCL